MTFVIVTVSRNSDWLHGWQLGFSWGLVEQAKFFLIASTCRPVPGATRFLSSAYGWSFPTCEGDDIWWFPLDYLQCWCLECVWSYTLLALSLSGEVNLPLYHIILSELVISSTLWAYYSKFFLLIKTDSWFDRLKQLWHFIYLKVIQISDSMKNRAFCLSHMSLASSGTFHL
jgi:hypothetical protein